MIGFDWNPQVHVNPLSATGPAVCLYPSLTPALILSCVQVADCAAPSAKCLRGDRAVVRARRDRKTVTTETLKVTVGPVTV
jgi:hypothetical protein